MYNLLLIISHNKEISFDINFWPSLESFHFEYSSFISRGTKTKYVEHNEHGEISSCSKMIVLTLA